MSEHERAVWEVAEATAGGAAGDVTVARQSPAPDAALDDEDIRRARFREALDHVMAKHHNVLAALAK